MALTILGIFAHPDDEIGVGSTLAHYGDAGVRTVLACATRGEAATIFCEECATRETLAEVRTRELECACQHLGVGELRWLDWPDGGIQGLPRHEAVGQVVALIRDIRPHIILTHPENGLYPHPDHLAVWEIVRQAFAEAAEPEAYPRAGVPWAVARLFTRALPQSFLDRSPGLAQFRVDLNGQQLPFYGTPDDKIDVVMHVEPWVERRMAAWECHRSQHNPKGFSSVMPDGVRQEMAANEHYLLVAARSPLPDGARGDLLAGLAEPQLSARLDFPPSPPDIVPLIRHELSVHRALVEACRVYLSSRPEPKYASLYQRVADGEQDILYLLARALRQAGETAGNIEANKRVRTSGLRASGDEARLGFLRATFTASLERLRKKDETWKEDEVSSLPRAALAVELVALTAAQLALLDKS